MNNPILDPARVSEIHGNLWRGNFPLNKDREVDFAQLDSLIGSEKSGLIQICLTDNTGEVDLLEVLERTYACKFTRSAPPFLDPQWDPALMHAMPYQNRLLCWWPIEGGTTPDVTGPSAQSYDFEGLIDFISRLNEMSAKKIYVHCLNGTDRTGAVAAAYAIRNMSMSLDTAIDWASRTAAHKMSQPYLDLVKAFSSGGH